MSLALTLIGGPAVIPLTSAFMIWSGMLVFGPVDGLEHRAGAEQGGTFDVEGLELETELIEYRNGSEDITVRKQPGLTKYANITLRMPTGFDAEAWRLTFERQVEIDKINQEFDEKMKALKAERGESQPESESPTEADEGVEMIQIDPPRLVIPVR